MTPPRNESGRPWTADDVVDIDTAASVRNADRADSVSETARHLEAAIAAADVAASAADWHEADRQLVLARHLVAVMEVLYPDGAEGPASGVPAVDEARVASSARERHPASGVVATPDATPCRLGGPTLCDNCGFIADDCMQAYARHGLRCCTFCTHPIHPTRLAVVGPDSSHPGAGDGGDPYGGGAA